MDVFLLPDGQWFVYGVKVSLWTGVVVGTVIGGLASFRLDGQKDRMRLWYLRAILFVIFLLGAGILSGQCLSGRMEISLVPVLIESGIDWAELWAGVAGVGTGICAGTICWVPILGLAGNLEWVLDDIWWKRFLLFCVCVAVACVISANW